MKEESFQKIELDILGMTCAACSARIEKVTRKMDGIENSVVNLATETASILYEPSLITKEDIIERIDSLGFSATYKKTYEEKKAEKKKELHDKKMTVIISSLFCIPLLITMITHIPFFNQRNIPEILMNPYFQFVFATPVQFYIGASFYKSAFFALKNKSANMDVLVVLGTSAAYFYSLYQTIFWEGHIYGAPISNNQFYYETAAVLITLILFGKYLEARAKYQTSEAIQHLVALQAKQATVFVNNEWVSLPVEKIKKNALILVKPGEKIALDGVIVEGMSTIDESMITGESIPVTKQTNDTVYGGTMNGQGSIQMNVTHTYQQSLLSQIIHTVLEAQTKKAPIQRVADKISGIFVPVVISIAFLTFLAWYFVFSGGDFSQSLEIAISVLVIACPCALGLATPTSIMVASGIGAENGILFKGGEYIERAYMIDHIVFDKTGTITKGNPTVTNTYFHTELAPSLFYSLEQKSEHPLAQAVMSYAEHHKIQTINIKNTTAVIGKGIYTTYENEQVFLGSKSYLLENRILFKEQDKAKWNEWEEQGHTVIGISMKNRLIGMMSVRDELKPTITDAITRLHELGKTVYLLTGDQKKTAQAIAKEAGITHIKAEVLPTEKASFIASLQEEGKKVCMVGDGINDAPALAQADIGIAMSTGTDIALETADITLLSGNVALLPKMFVLSQKTMKNIKQNLFWAFFYNLVGIPIAVLGFLAPWVAGAAMALSSVSVVANALRLKKVTLDK